MKIVILGAGQVGASVAEALVHEANDITIVDNDRERLAALQDRLDLRTVCGNAALPSILGDAGLDDADLLIAVTQSDQTNLVACKIAKSRFNVPTRIARLRAADFLEDEQLLSDENFAVDFAICPEENITDYIVRLVDFPEALQVLEFAEGRLVMVAVRAYEGGALVGKPVRKLREHLPSQVDARIAALFRQDQPIIPEGETVIHAGDEVFIIAASEHIRPVLRELRRMMRPVKRVMIAGGGNIGYRVATALQQRLEVKLVEHNRSRAEWIAPRLGDTLVLCGDATDEDLLEQENIAEMDLFLALTNDDEDNIMAASLAKRLGCQRVLALINRRAYADMVQGGPIDIGISPAQVSIGTLLAHVRRADVSQVHSLRRGAAEALELVAHGDRNSSRVVGRSLGEIPLPKGVTIAAIVRDLETPEIIGYQGPVGIQAYGHVVIAHRDTVIQSGDHVIVFCVNKKLVHKVEKLFQVGFGFL
ncbi:MULTISPECIES: Trk system potassium transporter TrkA [Azospira]|jgi:trk system potassium uptake protein TrkA|uniref:Trk system potassium uptake protein TrkA n=2 Tax=Azospira oryzae TaxID=146939 RepID=G8QHR4_AZOOP|nr:MULTISPECIES: Trk system potassium transporter TrkA [Azospira]TLS19484.1 MAG: Trk system potassium transporter TrkA [Betaproteobacteria bacterium]AEV25215.1 K+ transport system, NAD-binding component [Azospira oryzae PS]MBP7489941.1 Trk system potassium transporter TrkA [Azospira sp.]MDK9691257.1 Trk system potassium transporter TrkA [Azospira sp.]RZT76449.1 trk system potassium uptake protein TrkA [Azospira oryzae]